MSLCEGETCSISFNLIGLFIILLWDSQRIFSMAQNISIVTHCVVFLKAHKFFNRHGWSFYLLPLNLDRFWRLTLWMNSEGLLSKVWKGPRAPAGSSWATSAECLWPPQKKPGQCGDAQEEWAIPGPAGGVFPCQPGEILKPELPGWTTPTFLTHHHSER